MGDFSSGFGTGFQIGAIIKEKKIAKKATEDLQAALQEWQMSGKEPSYVDKLMLGLTATKVGENYSRIFGDIINNQASYDKEKMSQNAINLREYNAQVLNFVKMIQTSAKEGTLDLIPWDSVQALMPDVDLTKVLNSIPELKNKQYEAKTKEQNIDIYGKTPPEYRMGVGEQLGVIPEGVQPTTTPKEPTPLSAKDNWAIENYKTGKITFDQLSKYMGTLIEPEKATALEQKIAEAKNYGATNDEIKKMIVGGTGGGTTKQDPNDILFGTNGIMKNYINTGGTLGEEQKTEIRNNYNLIKPSLSADVRTQVEDYLQQIGIDLAGTEPIPESEPEPTKSNWLKDTWKKMTTPGGTPAYKGTPKQQDYTAMSDDQLADLALTGDQAAIDELKRRGLI